VQVNTGRRRKVGHRQVIEFTVRVQHYLSTSNVKSMQQVLSDTDSFDSESGSALILLSARHAMPWRAPPRHVGPRDRPNQPTVPEPGGLDVHEASHCRGDPYMKKCEVV
jgi:hypothetical protein